MIYVFVFWLGVMVGFFIAALMVAARDEPREVLPGPHEWLMGECINCGASQSGNRVVLACTPQEKVE